MKKTFYILAFISFLGLNNLKAQSLVATLDHAGTTTVFYSVNALVDAYNASVNGDVIVLSAGSFNPPTSIQKGIKLIGVGHYPDTVNNNTSFIIEGINLGLGANNLTIEGISTKSIINWDTIRFVTIKRCKIQERILFQAPSYNFSLLESVCPELNCSYLDFTITVKNNIFIGNTSSVIKNIYSGGLIENNIIYLKQENFGGGSLSYIYGSIIRNNVFYRGFNFWDNGIIPYCSGNTFLNNYIDNYGYPLDSIQNTFSNNYFGNISNIFPNDLGISFSYYLDYHILNPTQYLGTDGTQIGIYGGTNPYKENAVPSNPRIVSKYIAPQNDSNGNLQINIKAKAQNN